MRRGNLIIGAVIRVDVTVGSQLGVKKEDERSRSCSVVFQRCGGAVLFRRDEADT